MPQAAPSEVSPPPLPPPPEARAAFVEDHARLVYAAIGRALARAGVPEGPGRAELMEDLFASSFVAMFEDDARRLRLWDGRCSRETWLSLIAASVTRDHVRAERRRERRLDRETDPQALSDHIEIVDDREDEAQARRRLALALETLTEADRALISALVLDERPPGEVAAALGITPGTLYTRKSRALSKLRGAFDRAGREGEGVAK